jgi:L,D-peptidoglycan transpeptidase YkuD (ErfK/YbiS/YcfS/YnhG family)
MRQRSIIRIVPRPGRPTLGFLALAGRRVPVALGRAGIRRDKREGDGATPAGRFRPLRLWWRADRHPRPVTGLPLRPIRRDDAWCEDPSDHRYNRPFRLKPGKSGDRLWRNDQLYDFIIEIDHNTIPRITRRGSAVFLHLARPHFGPTAGCVAMTPAAMLQLLRKLDRNTVIVIG